MREIARRLLEMVRNPQKVTVCARKYPGFLPFSRRVVVWPLCRALHRVIGALRGVVSGSV